MKRLLVSLVAVIISLGSGYAADIGLTSVLYPDGKSVDVPISGTQRAPAAILSARVTNKTGQSAIVISQKNLPPALLFGGDYVSYVVWAIGTDGTFENLGGIANEDQPKSKYNYSTAKRDFAMMITAEPIVTVQAPGDAVVFFSGTPAAKDIQPTGFTFGGLADRGDYVSRDNESIAGMTYKRDKKNPVEMIQAEKAVELLDRFDAKKYDAAKYGEATAALELARESKSGAQIDAANRTVIAAGQALRKTSQMMEEEKKAARAAGLTAERTMGAVTSQELDDTQAALAAKDKELRDARSEISRAKQQQAKLVRQQQSMQQQQKALEAQLSGALGAMASGAKTDRGYVVSLSGVAFTSGSSDLTTETKYVLAKLSGICLVFPDMTLSVEGHTDSTGSAEVNQKLSLARATSVTDFLAQMSMPAARMKATGFGPDNPIAPNDTPQGRAKNRRVEIVFSQGD